MLTMPRYWQPLPFVPYKYLQSLAMRWALGCVNSAFWFPQGWSSRNLGPTCTTVASSQNLAITNSQLDCTVSLLAAGLSGGQQDVVGAAPRAHPDDHAEGPEDRQVALPARLPAPLQHTRTLLGALPRGTLQQGKSHNLIYIISGDRLSVLPSVKTRTHGHIVCFPSMVGHTDT